MGHMKYFYDAVSFWGLKG